MKRSEVNGLIRQARDVFAANGWALPPEPCWDVTDFGLGRWREFGLVLINLANEPEYCEKLMFALQGMTTPAHTHRKKKEDIIARAGTLAVQVWPDLPSVGGTAFDIRVNGRNRTIEPGATILLPAGHRITLVPGVFHAFAPVTPTCIIGEVSTANDDAHDNLFADTQVGRFPGIDEDEPPIVPLVSDAK